MYTGRGDGHESSEAMNEWINQPSDQKSNPILTSQAGSGATYVDNGAGEVFPKDCKTAFDGRIHWLALSSGGREGFVIREIVGGDGSS